MVFVPAVLSLVDVPGDRRRLNRGRRGRGRHDRRCRRRYEAGQHRARPLARQNVPSPACLSRGSDGGQPPWKRGDPHLLSLLQEEPDRSAVPRSRRCSLTPVIRAAAGAVLVRNPDRSDQAIAVREENGARVNDLTDHLLPENYKGRAQ